MDDFEIAQKLGTTEEFGNFFEKSTAQADGKRVAPKPAEKSQDSEQKLDEAVEETGDDAVDEGTSDAAPQEEEQADTHAEVEESEVDSDPDLGKRAKKRIEQLAREKNELRDQLLAMQAQMSAIQTQLMQRQEPQQSQEPKKKGWEDYSSVELQAILDNPEYEDYHAIARRHLTPAIKRELKEEAVGAVKQEYTVRERQASAASRAAQEYPEVTQAGSPLRGMAEKLYAEGIPEIGMTAQQLQGMPDGVYLATSFAFNRLAKTGQVKLGSQVQALKNKMEKANARGQLEGGGRPSAPKTKSTYQERMKAYKEGRVGLERVLEPLIADRLPPED